MRSFCRGAWARPRELTWIVAALVLGVVAAGAITGQMLPLDEDAYAGALVAADVAGPLGPVVRGGPAVGEFMLGRFFAAHALWLPAIALLLVATHLTLVARHGIAGGEGLPSDLSFEAFPTVPASQGTAKEEAFPPAAAIKPSAKEGRLTALECAGFGVLGALAILAVLAVLWPAGLGPPADLTRLGEGVRPLWFFLPAYEALKFVSSSFLAVGGVLAFIGVLVVPFARWVRVCVAIVLVAAILLGLAGALR